MNKARLRHWLLNGLNATAAVTLLLFALDKASATRGLVSDGLLLFLIFAVFLLVSLLLAVVFLLGRRATGAKTRGREVLQLLVLYFQSAVLFSGRY